MGKGWITSPGGPYRLRWEIFRFWYNCLTVWGCWTTVFIRRGSGLKYSQEDQEDQLNQCLLWDQQGPGWNMKHIFNKHTSLLSQCQYALKNIDSTHSWTFGSLGTLRTLHETGHKLSNLTKSLKLQWRILMNDWIGKRLTGRPGGPGGPRGPAAPLIPCDMMRWKQKSDIY